MAVIQPASGFGSTSVIPPRSEHTHTAILLHGRGSTGKEFAEELLVGRCSLVQDDLSGWRWVFPSSKEAWSGKFQENISTWFEEAPVSDAARRPELQAKDLLGSVYFIQGLVHEEIQTLGDAKRVVLGGISQGGAVAMWTLLTSGKPELGAFFAANTWLPLADELQAAVGTEMSSGETGIPADLSKLLGMARLDMQSARRTPLFMSHGSDDAYVDVELGREASRVLRARGWDVSWKEYTGAEQEGHWLKEPEQFDDIFNFFHKSTI